jgi:ATP-dependent helicase/nuclease subunit B
MKNRSVHIRFLLGPAGSGKTFRCLAEIRQALRAAPDGPPLILLAPKQATFQLERQLLEDTGLRGYTRLHILSFDRLAQFIFEQSGRPFPRLLAEEGRIMVLRAVLEQNRDRLILFRATARLPGFSRQLSQLLRELQQHHFDPSRLERLAAQFEADRRLGAKLHDYATLLRAYTRWLREHHLQDPDRLLDQASAVLADRFPPDARPDSVRDPNPASSAAARSSTPGLHLGGLWLDGFAQMTPQERALLAATVRCADEATLAFCLERAPEANEPWHSAWAPVTETALRCRDDLAALPGARMTTEQLERDPRRSRFQTAPQLTRLERTWGKPREDNRADSIAAANEGAIRIVACADPHAEVQCAAREIRRLVRAGRGRYRDAAVLTRSLEPYHDAIRRVFTQYEIPFFLDRRESVAHHPLAELTRYALRLAAYDWGHADFFGALKTGLVYDDDSVLDRLENEALARGWKSKAFWLQPLPAPSGREAPHDLEPVRRAIVTPFAEFCESVTAGSRAPDGQRLAAALRGLWASLQVGQRLERWNASALEAAASGSAQSAGRHLRVHETVWEQMIDWLGNLEQAFPAETMSLNDWMPIVEAGLANLTVGVIPPALDQVLVGAIDRSRNPDLRLAIVLGLNEGVFPAPPAAPALLTRDDRRHLAAAGAVVGPDQSRQIGLEQYYGYIACTRARERLVLTCSQRDSDGRAMNPSPFLDGLRRIIPDLALETDHGAASWADAEHWSELLTPALRNPALARQSSLLETVPQLRAVLSKQEDIERGGAPATLPAELVERLYGPELLTSVSALEDFAACPFKFLAARGLRATERFEFELDPRERGSFQHEVLREFHLRLEGRGKRWRDLTPSEARALVREVGETLLPDFRDGLFVASAARRFNARMLIEGLERFIETLIGWTRQYEFDPVAVETEFGLNAGPLPPWRIELDDGHALLLRGRIDRIDICRLAPTGETLGVVIDYKSGARQLDPVLLQEGLELQLLAYLGALAGFEHVEPVSAEARLVPAGAFYVALRGGAGTAKSRDAEKTDRETARREAWQHRGRFDRNYLAQFDNSGRRKGDQFKYALIKGGGFAARGNEALSSSEFRDLLAQVREFLRQHGRAIYAGEIRVAPYRLRAETACDLCRLRPICRFDPWTEPYRVLRPRHKSTSAAAVADGTDRKGRT